MNIRLEDIAYHLTSSKTKPNKTMKEIILPFFLSNNVKTILDYGCGKYLRDSLYFSENGFLVDAVDLEEQVCRIEPEKIKRIKNLSTEIVQNGYDAALLNFVLQVLPTPKQRREVLGKTYSAIKNEGYLVMSLRNQSDISYFVEEKGIPFNDGFLMRKGKNYTFVRGYEKTEIEELLGRFNLKIIEINKTSNSFITLSQK